MDGNGRWARNRGLPRSLGHTSGARRVRAIVEHAIARGIGHLTLFAFSSENWKRPIDEVSALMSLFMRYLEKEVAEMHTHGVRLRVIGDLGRFDARLRQRISDAQALTGGNRRLTLTIAANYGGRWDMLEAVRRWQAQYPGRSVDELDEEALRPHLSLGDAPDPDLLVRTGGEARISNYLLWQMAYTELYFTEVLWPDFTPEAFDQALTWYAARDRRFGAVSEAVAS